MVAVREPAWCSAEILLRRRRIGGARRRIIVAIIIVTTVPRGLVDSAIMAATDANAAGGILCNSDLNDAP